MTAGVVAGVARGTDLEAALRLGTAAGALDVTGRGPAGGTRGEIERLARRVELRRLT